MRQKISLDPRKKLDDGVSEDLFGIVSKALEGTRDQSTRAMYTKDGDVGK